MANVRSFLGYDNSYSFINREERNLAAIFYHVLLLEDNLNIFLDSINCDFPIVLDEMSIYFEYAFLRDLWKNIGENNEVKRKLIYEFLKPSNIYELERMNIFEFNKYFGAVPKPSKTYIQSPSNWSISRYKDTIKDNSDFLKVSKFKWAFNAKPDIVIHTSNETAICIECKVESKEGLYPADSNEKHEFKTRSIDFVPQTSLQKYILKDLLGINGKFIFLVKEESSNSQTHSTLLWKQAFSNLKLDKCPKFILDWINSL